jgi:hypothetical protein
MAGIIVAMSGSPIDVVDSAAGSLYGLNAATPFARPNYAPGATREGAMVNVPAGYFFNPYAFARPFVQAGQVIPSSNGTAIAGARGTDLGHVGRNILRGPRQNNVDLSIARLFRVAETKEVEFRADFFNLFNQVNRANPISNFDAISSAPDPVTGQIPPGAASDFGRIKATSTNPRLIQFALKFSF